jgi:hypothetical protein
VVILPAITLPVKRPVLMLSLMGAAGLQLCRPLHSSAEVTPGRGELPALVSMLLANYCDGEALHVYQPSLPPRIAIRGLDCSAL